MSKNEINKMIQDAIFNVKVMNNDVGSFEYIGDDANESQENTKGGNETY